MKRIFSILTVIIMLLTIVFTATSCDRDYDEEEVLTAAGSLLRKAQTLNEIYYGRGLMCDELSVESVGSYRLVLDEELEKYGINTLDDIKVMTRNVFTAGCSSEIINTRLDSIYDANGEIIYQARYIEHSPGADKEKFIYVDPNYTVLMTDTIEYYFDTVKVKDVEELYIYMSVEAKITNQNGDSRIREIEFTMLEEESGWRLDSLTFAVYEEVKK